MSKVKKAEDILNNFFTYMYKWDIYIIGIFTPIFIAIKIEITIWINSV